MNTTDMDVIDRIITIMKEVIEDFEKKGDAINMVSMRESLSKMESIKENIISKSEDKRHEHLKDRAFTQDSETDADRKELKKRTWAHYQAEVVVQGGLHPEWRKGQTCFNVLQELHPEIAYNVRGSAILDPFHLDANIARFLEHVEEIIK